MLKADGWIEVEQSEMSHTRTWILANGHRADMRAPVSWSYTAEGLMAGRWWSCGHVHDTALLAHRCELDWMGNMGLDRRRKARRVLTF